MLLSTPSHTASLAVRVAVVLLSLLAARAPQLAADRAGRCTRTRSRKEQAVRTALADADASARDRQGGPRRSSATTRQSCGAIPTSGYSDNALWQARRAVARCLQTVRRGARQDRRRPAAARARVASIRRASSRSRCRRSCVAQSIAGARPATAPCVRRRVPRPPTTGAGSRPSRPAGRRAKLATIKDIRRDGAARRRARHDRARRRSARSTTSGLPNPCACLRRSAGDARRAGARRSDASASRATPTSCGRSASAGIRTARRASCSMRPASRATACTRCTARTGW